MTIATEPGTGQKDGTAEPPPGDDHAAAAVSPPAELDDAADESALRREIADAYRRKHDELRAEIADFDDVVLREALPAAPHVADALLDSAMTARLEYYLAKNKAELFELNRMSPTRAARAIGRLEERLGKSPAVPSKAPAPLPPLRGGSAGPRQKLADMSMEEYVAARRAGRTE